MARRSYPKSIYIDTQFGALGQANCFNKPHLDKSGRFKKLFNAYSYGSATIEREDNKWIVKWNSQKWEIPIFVESSEIIETKQENKQLFS